MTARLLMVAIQPRKGGECLASISMAGYCVSISTDQGGGKRRFVIGDFTPYEAKDLLSWQRQEPVCTQNVTDGGS
jgi:hypothetical protein